MRTAIILFTIFLIVIGVEGSAVYICTNGSDHCQTCLNILQC